MKLLFYDLSATKVTKHEHNVSATNLQPSQQQQQQQQRRYQLPNAMVHYTGNNRRQLCVRVLLFPLTSNLRPEDRKTQITETRADKYSMLWKWQGNVETTHTNESDLTCCLLT